MTDSSNPLNSNTLKAAFREALKSATKGSSGMEFLLMATSDGYALCDTISDGSNINRDSLAAMAASFAGISDGLASQSNKPAANGSIIETNAGLLVCKQLKSNRHEVVLLGAFEQSTNHGIALWSLNKVVSDVLAILENYN
ncbi:roadblock/LC7 domain-containing protein [Oceanobacter kriegii]|uniref:roadblock/LC7 domain-containing protein n=1 Tax=Oceanobacter kriegii TaxID=64972 RepID=UPI000408A259|nr:hypothetical protein [Oceanobacter kriegii]